MIVCRFHLTLQDRNKHAQSSISSSEFVITSVHDAAQMMHDAMVEQFGEHHSNPSLGAASGVSAEEIEDQQNPESATDAGIDIHEFSWATGDIGDVGAVGLVTSGEPQLLLHTHRLKGGVESGITGG